MTTNRILSGVQPTGNLHLGNYLGAIRNWVTLQKSYECYFMLADLHAITVPQEPDALRRHVRETAAAYIACGIDPEQCAIFPQSAISGHAELAWILSCHTPLGWLNRMTQFKEKAGTAKEDLFDRVTHLMLRYAVNEVRADRHKQKAPLSMIDEGHIKEGLLLYNDKQGFKKDFEKVWSDYESLEKAKLGLYAYPVLMAADILLYKATHVPVGEDQKQHLELARDIAGAFNRQYGQEFFPLPEPVILKNAARIMSLRDGTSKMSKSDESDYSRINLTDDTDIIAKKFRKAKSDMVGGKSYNDDSRPEAKNLLTIYAAIQDITIIQAAEECDSLNFSAFKQKLTDAAVAHLAPITSKMRDLMQDEAYLDTQLKRGIAKASLIATDTMRELKDVVGFITILA